MKYILPLVLVAGCAVTPEMPAADPFPKPDADSCQGAQYAGLIGQDATALERVLILRQVRVIRPGDAVTRDYRRERLNFMIGADETIQRITCG